MYSQINSQERAKRKFVGDRENSTYRWELYLKGEKAYTFDGYSKSRNQAEKHDKQALFQDCVARICYNGYLDKTYQMLWFRRAGILQHKNEDRLLLEMYPTHFVAHNELQLDLATLNYLQRLYDAKLSGQPFDPIKLLPPRESVRDVEALDFKFSTQRFPTEDLLVEHCKELIKRYPYARVEAWWRTCKEVYVKSPAMPTPLVYRPEPANYQQPARQHQTPDMTPPGAHIDLDNEEAAKRAKQAVNNMNTHFRRGM
ncbi:MULTISPECIES: hypothetical protein [unclassified Spirosoma]|uniref:hypothetical protein n=1 Tax=unclassified Spirosoma TaxID=2621999 RepID=UPI00095C5184|nr:MULTISPECIES: hypothetical protein [unclassified Spirosoma]MBN8820783.1 hypothetical protein [Spirosoma sp.]OJW76376.1 MAG: hypothetical protein BGO59_22920 [Spirosoma sp. 48-14]